MSSVAIAAIFCRNLIYFLAITRLPTMLNCGAAGIILQRPGKWFAILGVVGDTGLDAIRFETSSVMETPLAYMKSETAL
jgi:hypothetical protein